MLAEPHDIRTINDCQLPAVVYSYFLDTLVLQFCNGRIEESVIERKDIGKIRGL